jgi:hypothetical protein
MSSETAQELFDALSAPFMTECIEWRIGSMNPEKTRGLPLAYIDARTVMDRLDSACGMEGWQCKYEKLGNTTICTIGIRVPGPEKGSDPFVTVHQGASSSTAVYCNSGEWVWKADGAGDTDFEAEKGALSDAFKRAAVRFGVGRYLYDLKSEWIELENKRIPDKERRKLDELHERAITLHGWGPRAGIQVYRLLKKLVALYVTDAGEAQDFKVAHKAEMSLLPVAMRRHLEEQLDRIGGELADWQRDARAGEAA